MTKDDFKACAGVATASDTANKAAQVAAVVAFTPAPMLGLRAPAPKAPFGMPQMPMAINIKVLPPQAPASVTKFSARAAEVTGDEE